QVVAVLERPLPDPARQPVPATVLHDPEEIGLRPVLDLLARLDLHRGAPGVGLHAALAAAGAASAAPLHDHVPDLAGRPPPQPGFAVRARPAADTGAPPDPEDGVELLARAQLELALHRDLNVVADRHRYPELLGEVFPQREGSGPPAQVPGVGDDAGRLIGVAGRANADAAELLPLDVRLRGRLAQGRGHLSRDVLGTALRGSRATGLAQDLVLGVDDDR